MNVIWDQSKNLSNQEKHGVSFEDAQRLFLSGSDFLELYDDDHSVDEDRYIAIGIIVRGVVLVVWTERDDDVIRIISARWATPRERDRYLIYAGELK